MTLVPTGFNARGAGEFRRAIDCRMLPADLSRCIGCKTLVRIILGEVDRLLERQPAGRDAGVAVESRRPFLLTLLGYCYSTGALASVDIELGARTDPMLRYLCTASVPDIDSIRLFRRAHHEQLIQLLAAVFRRVWELRFDEAADSLPADTYAASSLHRWLPSAPDFLKEARNRLSNAVRADSMALDA